MEEAGKRRRRAPTRGGTPGSGILVVDDHPVVREGLRKLISAEPGLRVCGEAADASTAWESVEALRPDVVIVDVELHDGDGIELAERMRRRYPELPIVVMSMHDGPGYVERTVRAGASGFVAKRDASEKIIQALRAVLEGQVYYEDRLTPALLGTLGTDRDPDDRVPPLVWLSSREREVFRLISQGLNAREIGERLHVGLNTVNAYHFRIRGKLGLASTRTLVQYAVRWGLNREPPPKKPPERGGNPPDDLDH